MTGDPPQVLVIPRCPLRLRSQSPGHPHATSLLSDCVRLHILFLSPYPPPKRWSSNLHEEHQFPLGLHQMNCGLADSTFWVGMLQVHGPPVRGSHFPVRVLELKVRREYSDAR